MPTIQSLELNPLVERTCALLDRVLDARVALRLEPEPGLPLVLGDSGLLEQVVLRLGLLEAEALNGAGGTLRIRTHRHGDLGVTLELRREPWGGSTSAVAARQSALHAILDTPGAEILKDGPEEGGWTLEVLLPADRSASRPRAAQAGPPSAPRLEGLRILVAEDEPEIRFFLREILGQLGAEVIPAVDGEDAWNLWSLLGPFDLLLTDQRMPRLTGMELLQRVRSDRPGFPVVLMSGFGLEEFAATLERDLRLRFLPKPFLLPALLEAVGGLLAGATPRSPGSAVPG